MSDIFNQYGDRSVLIRHKFNVIGTVILFHRYLDFDSRIRGKMLLCKLLYGRFILRFDHFFFRDIKFLKLLTEFLLHGVLIYE